MKLSRDFRLLVEYLVHLLLGSAVAAAFLLVSFGFEWFADVLVHQKTAPHIAAAAEMVSWTLLVLDALLLFMFLVITTYKSARQIWKHRKDDNDE